MPLNKNLLVIFDQSLLPTVIGDDVNTASTPAPRYAVKGQHTIHVVGGMTGETSPPAVFRSR